MKKTTIVCDIDDVIFPFIDGVADHYNEKFGASLTPEDFVSFQFFEVWGGTQEDSNIIIEDFMGKSNIELIPVDGAVEAFDKLAKDFEIVMVTARNGLFEENTVKWLQRHFPDLFTRVIFAGNPHDGRGYRSKGEIARELGAALIIDDHPDNIASAVAEGVDGILFGTKAWTTAAAGKIPHTVHCETWKEVEDYIYGRWQRS